MPCYNIMLQKLIAVFFFSLFFFSTPALAKKIELVCRSVPVGCYEGSCDYYLGFVQRVKLSLGIGIREEDFTFDDIKMSSSYSSNLEITPRLITDHIRTFCRSSPDKECVSASVEIDRISGKYISRSYHTDGTIKDLPIGGVYMASVGHCETDFSRKF